jgi:iron complex outermembrane recepter protein
MKKIFPLIAAYVFATLSFTASAATNEGKVLGTVIGGDKPLEAASVSLLKSTDSSVIKMAVTDKAGHFTVEKVSSGKYLVKVTAVGFTKYFTQVFDVNEAAPVYNVKPIKLSPATKTMQAVVVTSKKQFIEQKIDRTVVNVDASPTNTGLTAMEVLEKSPGISVDKDGNISLKGKQGVMVMVDGKPTYLSAQDLANMLKNMPSNHLDQIEIMTNPPAKYDAAGNAGIINIKTKKNKMEGFNGSITAGAGMGINPKSNNNFNLNYRKGKVNLFGNYSYNYNKGHQSLELTRIFRNQNDGSLNSRFEQVADMTPKFQQHSFKVGADYFVSKKTTVGIVVNGFYNPQSFSNTNTTYMTDSLGSLITRTDAKNLSSDKWKNIGGNLNLRHIIDTVGTEITADLDYVNYSSKSNQMFENYFYDRAGTKKQPDEFTKGYLPSNIKIYSAKVDYTHPLKGNAKIEAGAKTSFVETDNDAQYLNYINSGWTIDGGRSNHFVYKENINAAYVNSNKQFSKKWSGQLGLRLENTNSKGNQVTTGQTFNRNYTQLFPTAYLGYTLNDKNQFSLNYGKRINRPSYQDMNPFYYFIDKYTYQVGNPYLQPQFSHNVELNYNYKGFLNTGVYYAKTTNVIQQVLNQVDSTHTSYVTQDNIAKKRSYGMQASANFSVTKWWRANLYANVFNNRFEGLVNGAYLTVDGTTFMTNVSNQFTFKKGWSAEVSGFYRTKGVEGTLAMRGMGVVNLGASKQLLKNKGTVRLSVRDFLNIQQFRGTTKFQNIDVTIRNKSDNRVVSVSFTYRFGKAQQSAPQRKRGGSDDEQSRVKSGAN